MRLLSLLALLLCPAPLLALEFESAESEHYRLSWTSGLEGFAQEIMEGIEASHKRIYSELGSEAKEKIQIYLLRDSTQMRAEAARRHGGEPPEWAGGLAYPSAHHIYLSPDGGPAQLQQTLQHEISHVALGALNPSVPRWFHEGIAIRQSETYSFRRAWLLTEAASQDQLLPLRDLSRGFPKGGPRAGIAYAQAVHFVGWLEDRFGSSRFKALLKALAQEEFPLAIESAFGISLAEIEVEWRKSLRIWWGWLPVLFGSTSLWTLGTLLLILAWRKRCRERVLKMALMAQEEAKEDAPQESPSRVYDPYEGRSPTLH